MLNLDAVKLTELFNSDSNQTIEEVSGRDIAIVGMAVHLPSARNVDEFWENLKEGKDCITEFPKNREKDAAAYLNFIGMDEAKIKFGKGAYLSDVDSFDYSFFQLSPKEAELMHPDQRLFLETAWKAIEDSGYSGERIKGSKTGVYIGHSTVPFTDTLYDYSRFIAENDESLIPMALPGNLHSIIASRISYILDLKGPSIAVDTACSSSLVAVHLACQSIRNGECNMAIAGSVKTNLFPLNSRTKLGIEASDERAKTFDDSSDGTARGEGVVAIILKPLSHAVRDRDQIYAVIKGSAMNQDGSSIGITAPNAVAQENVITASWENAGIDPETIAYIEAHGTGTALGDPIEIDGITRAFSMYTDKKQFCGIGAVKTNIGHLDNCAGIVGLIKAGLALKNREIPPTLNFHYPNRQIAFENTPVYVNNVLQPWESEGFPRRCGVSSFGLSGTNCHMVLEEAPDTQNHEEATLVNKHVLTLSAKSKASLTNLIDEYYQFSLNEQDKTIASLCYTSNTGRGQYNYRVSLLIENVTELQEKLRYLLEHELKGAKEKNIYVGEHKQPLDEQVKNMLSHSAKGKIAEYLDSTEKNLSLLEEICELYCEGATINWSEFYSKERIFKRTVPTYSFEKRRCWYEVDSSKRKIRIMEGNERQEEQLVQLRLFGKDGEVYTETEYKVAQIWAETLGFDELSIDDNFYELGGDSIIATRIINSVNQAFKVNLEVTSLLRHPSIKELVHLLEESGAEMKQEGRISSIVPIEKKDYYQISTVQKQVFAQSQYKHIEIALNMPIVLEFKGLIDRERIQFVFDELIRRHEVFRTRFSFADGEIVQYIADDLDFKVGYCEIAEQELNEKLTNLVQPFKLEVAPLIRATLLKLSNKRHVLFFDMHHIISDGKSCDVFIKEMISLYENELLSNFDVQYKDFVVWQEEYLKTEHITKQGEYWKGVLNKDPNELQIPIDFEREEEHSFKGKTIEFKIPSETTEKLMNLAKELSITTNTLLFGAYILLLSEYSSQSDITVGTIVNGRNHHQIENMLGAFVNLLPIRNQVNREHTLREFLKACNEVLLGAYENQDYPYTRMIEENEIKTERGKNPLFNTVFVLHNEYSMDRLPEVNGTPFTVRSLPTNTSKLDLKLDVFNSVSHDLLCLLEYNTKLYKEETIQKFSMHFTQLLEKMIRKFEQKLGDIQVLTVEEKTEQAKKASNQENQSKKSINLAISATFTAEPIEPYIKWWGDQFNLDVNISFAPYNQVFMELLDTSSLLSTNKDVNLLFVRFEDWIRASQSIDDDHLCEELFRNFNEFVSILKNKSKQVPYFVGVFPVSTHLGLSKKVSDFIQTLNHTWMKILNESDNVYMIDFSALNTLYSIEQIFDAVKDAEGHVPFSDEFYAAMGAMVIRNILALKNQQFKVIVLDCDNTLWRGVCGEDGALSVRIEQPFIELQKFMIKKYEEGMLLAIVSKNNEEDVWEVFEKNPGMLLKKEHFVNWRINWEPKSQNMKEIAEELNLGLNSFIFVDDSLTECLEVMTNCPEVLSLHLPENVSEILAYLSHVWAFDNLIVTEEDKMRTEMYVAERQRKAIQEETMSIPDYLAGLELKMSMNKVEKSQIARVSQLTQRTNQFNLSTKRRTVDEIEHLLKQTDTNCWTIEVSDRFGDYGLVGVVITKEVNQKLNIDTFLLSCRVLSRRIEDAILVGLNKHCQENGLSFVEATYYPTAKNQPFKAFINRMNWEIVEETDSCLLYRMPVNSLPQSIDVIDTYFNANYEKAAPAVTKESMISVDDVQSTDKKPINLVAVTMAGSWGVNTTNDEHLTHLNYLVPLKNHSADMLVKLPKQEVIQRENNDHEYVAPRNEVEERIERIWNEVLGIEKISINASFFSLGASSLDGIQVISRMAMDFDAHLNDIFIHDTIAKLAENVPFKQDHLLQQFKKMEQLANVTLNTDLSQVPAVTEKMDKYYQQIEANRDTDLDDVVEYKNILLTGATGYLGAHLLIDMLNNTSSTIHLLIRGITPLEAENRFKQKMAFYFTANTYEAYKDRIVIYNGDISQRNMGLSQEVYNKLANLIDCVMNSAANVSHYGKYEDSYEVNVIGTERLLEFAFTGQQKDVHHLSTPLVAHGKIDGVDYFVYTEYDHFVGQRDENVYVKSKLEAEMLIEQARKKGLNCNIYRVGNLNYNTQTMKFQENIESNAFYTMVKSFIKINMVPALEADSLDFSFVDYVSKAIILLFNRKNIMNETFHVYNHNRISSHTLGHFIKEAGYPDLQISSLVEFNTYAFANYQNSELKEHIVNILVHAAIMGNLNDTNFITRSEKTNIILEKLGYTWVEPEKDHIEKMLEYSQAVNFITN